MKTVKWAHYDGKQAGKTFEYLVKIINELGLPLHIKLTYTSEERLTKALEIAESALSSICKHEGHNVLDISRNKAVEGFRNNLHICRKALEQIKKIKKGE